MFDKYQYTTTNYKQKYKKYKQKNCLLTNKMYGGFYLSDVSFPKTLLNLVTNKIKGNEMYFNAKNQIINMKSINEMISFYEGSFYKNVYEKLIEMFFDKSFSYDQTFSTTDWNKYPSNQSNPFYVNTNTYKYHINFAALMFTSYLLENELFSLCYNIVPFNDTTHQTKNNLSTLNWADMRDDINTKKRIYKNNTNDDIKTRLNIFCKILDITFYQFMTNLVLVITTKMRNLCIDCPFEENDIYLCIVPTKHFDHIKKGVGTINDSYFADIENHKKERNGGKFDGSYEQYDPYNVSGNHYDYIYVDWKDRIKKFIKTKLPLLNDGDISKTINIAIEDSMNDIEIESAKYIADATGFFSYMHMEFPEYPGKNYGSCITYSLFEFYIMARLHIHPNNMFLLVEAPTTNKHEYWENTQNATGDIASHWATEFAFNSYTMQFRHMSDDGYEIRKRVNFFNEPKLFFQYLMYPVIDSCIIFLNQNMSKFNSNQKTQIQKILAYSARRFELFQKIVELFNAIEITTQTSECDTLITNTLTQNPIVIIDIQNLIENKCSNPSIFNELILQNYRKYMLIILDQTKQNDKNLFHAFKFLLHIVDKLTLDSVVDLINTYKVINKSLLHIASAKGDIHTVRKLLSIKDININVTNPDGNTPLHGACWGFPDYSRTLDNRKAVVLELLSKNARVDILNEKNQYAFNFARDINVLQLAKDNKLYEKAIEIIRLSEIDVDNIKNMQSNALDSLIYVTCTNCDINKLYKIFAFANIANLNTTMTRVINYIPMCMSDIHKNDIAKLLVWYCTKNNITYNKNKLSKIVNDRNLTIN